MLTKITRFSTNIEHMNDSFRFYKDPAILKNDIIVLLFLQYIKIITYLQGNKKSVTYIHTRIAELCPLGISYSCSSQQPFGQID